MGSAGKRKKSSHTFTKQSEAHSKNIFFKKVIHIAKAVSEGDSYRLLTKEHLKSIYGARFRPLRVVVDGGLKIAGNDIRYLKEIILFYLKDRKIQLKKTGYEITPYDFLGPGITLWAHLQRLKEKEPDKHAEIISAFGDFIEDQGILYTVVDLIHLGATYFAWELSSFDKRYISIKISFRSKDDDPSFLFPEARIRSFNPDVLNIMIDGNCRPVFRIGTTYRGGDVFWINFSAKNLGLPHFSPDYIIPVYIQHHALNRLKERLDSLHPHTVMVNLLHSIAEAECISYNEKKLVKFDHFGHKIGYLVIELTQGVAVIRTFLLLTNNSTPEGNALTRIIGLEKHDVSYLNLDKISTFVHSGLRENKTLCDLFTRAGCGPLLKIEREHDEQRHVMDVSIIEAYLSKYYEHTKSIQLEEVLK